QVCIVGGGLAGLCTALGLVERGVTDVVVLDSERVGFGASGRNGGFVFGGYSLDNADLLRTLGRDEGRRLYRLTVDAVDLIHARIARYGIDCDIVDQRFAFDYYRPLKDTRILWGGRISVLDRGPDAIARLLRRDLLRVYPQLEGVKVDYAWGGLMSYARHKMPQIGRDADGVWHAIAFGGHGMAPTTVAGETLAAALAEGRPVPDGFAAFGLTRTF
ncbi:FAD-binding oxidoreductase, partial [Burkholderia cenocepacia]|nr:FAD-binding oxidoreductase [Burkholderia cenocepacia]MDR5670887.1 FAD-binding oxidoreductase [Burkholderia cenocepacia]